MSRQREKFKLENVAYGNSRRAPCPNTDSKVARGRAPARGVMVSRGLCEINWCGSTRGLRRSRPSLRVRHWVSIKQPSSELCLVYFGRRKHTPHKPRRGPQEITYCPHSQPPVGTIAPLEPPTAPSRDAAAESWLALCGRRRPYNNRRESCREGRQSSIEPSVQSAARRSTGHKFWLGW
jgi:hypothetical protein